MKITKDKIEEHAKMFIGHLIGRGIECKEEYVNELVRHIEILIGEAGIEVEDKELLDD